LGDIFGQKTCMIPAIQHYCVPYSILLYCMYDNFTYICKDDDGLNEGQKEAVKIALIPENKLLLIQGPPGILFCVLSCNF